MLYIAGASDRLGRVSDGNTVLDFDSEEKRRKSSVSSAIAALEWDNTKLNIIDAPGLFDFEGGAAEAVRAAEAVLIVTSAGSGVDVGTEKHSVPQKKGCGEILCRHQNRFRPQKLLQNLRRLKRGLRQQALPDNNPVYGGQYHKVLC